jgi:hypothetical protein
MQITSFLHLIVLPYIYSLQVRASSYISNKSTNYVVEATISQVYYLTFIYSSTNFGRPHAHNQELNNDSSSFWFYRWSVVVAVLLVWLGRPDRDQQHCYHHAPTVKPEAATAVVELLMMGVRTPKIC